MLRENFNSYLIVVSDDNEVLLSDTSLGLNNTQSLNSRLEVELLCEGQILGFEVVVLFFFIVNSLSTEVFLQKKSE
jgi:hypothetical protein